MTAIRYSLFQKMFVLLLFSLALSILHSASAEPIIVDHTCTDITQIPQNAIEQAKNSLHIAYGHTSHGSQLITGMTGLIDFANNGGLGLSLPTGIFAWNNGGTNGALDLHDQGLRGDVGYYPRWVDETRDYLDDPSHSDVNVIIWSWCGQVSGRTEQEIIDEYLEPMTQLEQEYPGVTFVYMTGHADGRGETGNLHLRNQQIRTYCEAHNKVLYDFYDIECFDPENNYYGDKLVNDNCDYDSDGNGTRDRNWAIDWQNAHTVDVDWYDCESAHSQPLNANRKAYAAWWLWARIAGWNPGGTEYYTLAITPDGDGTVMLDPAGGNYLAGTDVELTAQPGAGWAFAEWSGDLSGSQNPATISMDNDKDVTATFTEIAPAQFTLEVHAVGDGTITLDPPGGSYDPGTNITLTAQPDSGWEFSDWSGDLSGDQNPVTIMMDSDKTITATFTQIIPIQYELTIGTSGSGIVTLDPPGGSYDPGTNVTLTARPDSGWEFSDWSGDLTGDQTPVTIIMDSDKTVTATFTQVAPIQYDLTIGSSGSGIVTLDPPGGSYDSGTHITLTAQPASNWEFSNWSGDLSGDQNPVTIMMDSDKDITASFIESEEDLPDDPPDENPDDGQAGCFLKTAIFID